MSTRRQIEANRLNSQKSTGPRTLQGKAVSRFNALKTGIDSISEIIPGEDCDELFTLSAEYYQRWQPSLPEERCLVDILVNDEWQLRRLRKAEAQLWIHVQGMYCILDGRKTNAHQGAVLERSGQEFARLQRRIVAIEKSYHLNLEILRSMEAQAPTVAGLPPGADAAQPESPQPTTQPQAEIGFVPPTAPEPAQPETPDPAPQSQPRIGFVPQRAAVTLRAADLSGRGPASRHGNQEAPQPDCR